MSHLANDYVKKLFRDRVTRRQKLLLWSLADYHNTSRRAAWPAIRTLAEESLMDIRECRRVLDELEAAGLILRTRGGSGPGDFNEYKLVELDCKDGHMTPLSEPAKDGQKDGRKDGSKDGLKGGQNGRAIRKEPEPEREPEQKHHGKAALSEISDQHNSEHKTSAMSDWVALKEYLRSEIGEVAYACWLRPMYLLKVLSGNACLFALPANKEIVDAARDRQEYLAAALERRGYHFAGFTAYPSEAEMVVLRAEDALRAKRAHRERVTA